MTHNFVAPSLLDIRKSLVDLVPRWMPDGDSRCAWEQGPLQQ